MNAPQILIIVFFSIVLFFRIVRDFCKACSQYSGTKHFGWNVFGYMIACFFINTIYFGIVFGLLIWGNFFSSK